MKVYRKDSGERYTPFSHFDMTTQVIFNPDGGCRKVNVTLSTLRKGAGSTDEVHDHSDQVFYMIQGTMLAWSGGKLQATLHEGDAILVPAGEPHAVTNQEDLECVYLALTAPPLERTH